MSLYTAKRLENSEINEVLGIKICMLHKMGMIYEAL